MATTNLQTPAITDGIRQVAVETAERVVREALGLGTKYISVNDDNPVLLIDEYFYATGVGRQKGLKHLVKEGYIKRVDNPELLKAMGFTSGCSNGIYVPTDKTENVCKVAAQIDTASPQGRNTHKLLITVPDGMDFLSSKVFTPDVRISLYVEQWGQSQTAQQIQQIANAAQ
jgi:hypothetical protein